MRTGAPIEKAIAIGMGVEICDPSTEGDVVADIAFRLVGSGPQPMGMGPASGVTGEGEGCVSACPTWRGAMWWKGGSYEADAVC